MKMFNKERKFAVMNVQNHSWICPCSNQFMEKEMQCMMYLSIGSFLEKIMFDGQHPYHTFSFQQLRSAFLKQFMGAWMNVYSMGCMSKCMNICTFQCLCISMLELINTFMNKLISKLIKSINIILNIKN